MVDKMMRMSGRGEDGTAKALKTDNNGNLDVRISKSKSPEEVVLSPSLLVSAGTTINAVSSYTIGDASSFFIGIGSAGVETISVDIQPIVDGFVLPIDERIMDRLVLNGGRGLSRKYNLKTPQVRIKITNHSTTDATLKVLMYKSYSDTREFPQNQMVSVANTVMAPPIRIADKISVASGAKVTVANAIDIGNYSAYSIGVVCPSKAPEVTVETRPVVGGFTSTTLGNETLIANSHLNGGAGISKKHTVRTPQMNVLLKNHSPETQVFDVFLYLYNDTTDIPRNMEYYGASLSRRPDANTVPVGAIYFDIATQLVYQSDGFVWREV